LQKSGHKILGKETANQTATVKIIPDNAKLRRMLLLAKNDDLSSKLNKHAIGDL
jgi:hypothetical protein